MRRTFLLFGLLIALLATSIPAQAVKVYFNNPHDWSTVVAYFHNNDEAAWPGNAVMTQAAGSSLWSVDVPSNYASTGCYVIFNNNNNGQQFPASGGLQVADKDMVLMLDKNNATSYIWTEYESAAFNVYFDNSYANWSTVKLHYWGASGTDWEKPVQMDQVEGDNTCWVYQVPAGTAGLIFRDGGSNQSSNLTAKKDHKYSNTADLGAYVAPTPSEPFDIYFDNYGTGWETPYIYYWGGSSTVAYPGVAMEAVNGKPGVYKKQVAANTSKILFSAGGTTANADATKTADMDAQAGYIYNQSGVIGEYSDEYVREVAMPSALYLLTNDGVDAMNPNKGVAMTQGTGANKNKFTVSDVEIKVSTVGGATGYFNFATKKDASWDVVNTGDRFGPATENATLTDGVGTMVKYAGGNGAASCKSWVIAPGKYTFTVDMENMTVTVSGNALVAGTGKVNIPGVTVQAGGDSNIAVQLATESSIVGMQLDIALPNVIVAATPVLATALEATHHIEGNTVNGKYRVVISSDENTPFAVTNGTIFSLPFSVASTVAPGDYDIDVTNIILSDANLLKATLEAGEIGKVTVTAAAASTIKLDQTELALQKTETATLVATNADDEALTGVVWASSNTDVATVDQTGKVTAVENGTAVITATHGTAKATCNVTVGKKKQTITWDQEFEENYKIGRTIEFTATSDNNTIPVTYAIISGSAYATLNGNELTTVAAGVVTVQARQEGNDTYAPANPVNRNITIWLGYKPGDVNGDNKFTIADATMTIQKILGKEPADFNETAADVNGDNTIDIVDVTLIVDLAKKYKANNPTAAPARVNGEDLEEFSISGSDYMLRISFTNMENYIATQFDLTLPEGNEVASALIAGSDHRVTFSNNEGSSRVIAYSNYNETFAGDGYITVMLKSPLNGPVTLDNALINRTDGDNVLEVPARGAGIGTTGLQAIMADGNAECEVYTVDGICIFKGTADTFRANGYKGLLIVRSGNNVQKLIVR